MKGTFKRAENDSPRTKSVYYDPSRDKHLSAKAKGILYYLLLRPHDWKGQFYDIAEYFTDGTTSIRSGIKELIDRGYMRRVHPKQDGKFVGSYYEFSGIRRFQ